MSAGLTWREIDAVLEELELGGCFIRDLRQPVPEQLVFELYAPRRDRFWLLVSFAARHTRLHRLAHRPRALGDNQRFVAFMRAHVRGRRIGAAAQVGEERIVKLALAGGTAGTGAAGAAGGGPPGATGAPVIWLRLWGNAANCIVTRPDGRILDALYRRPRRGEISGGDYHPARDLERLRANRLDRAGGPANDAELRPFGDPATPYNLRVEHHYAEREAAERAAAAARTAARQRAAAEQRLRRLTHRLERELAATTDHERLRQLGNLLLANLTLVEPGARRVRVDDYYTGGTTYLELTPTLTPAANAEAYFARARRAERRHAAAAERLGRARAELAQVEAGDSTAPAPVAPPRPVTGGGALAVTSAACTLVVGRSARENDDLLRRARGNDWWLHCRDYPGAHVFVRAPATKSVPLETLLDAGNLAVFYSKARTAGRADVYYTQVKHLRRPRTRGRGTAAAGRGRVIPTHARNLFITLDQTRIDRLLRARGAPGSTAASGTR